MIREMEGFMKIFFTIALATGMFITDAMAGSEQSYRLEVFMTRKHLIENKVDTNFIYDIDISPENLLLISSQNQMYRVAVNGIRAYGKRSDKSISSFAYLPDSLLCVVRGNELCTLDNDGNLSRFIGLPEENMGVSPGKYSIYVYGRDSHRNKQPIYMIAKGGGYTKLLEVPAFIHSVAEIDNTIVFATDDGIFQYSFKNKELKLIARSPKGKSIISMSVDKPNNCLYYSTDDMIFAIKGNQKVTVTDKIGGALKYHGGLFVFDCRANLLVRLSGIDEVVNNKIQELNAVDVIRSSYGTLTNASIIEFVKKKYSEDMIIYLINTSKVNFELGVDPMVNLSGNGVSSRIIMSMRKAMKRTDK